MTLPDTKRRSIKAVIFDMDGLLLDSESIYTTVTNEVLAPFNKQLTWEIKSLLMGRPARESAKILIQQTGIPLDPDQLIAQMTRLQIALFSKVQPMPGALQLVQLFHKSQIPMAIATGSNKKNFTLKSQNLSELFEPFKGRVVCGDDPELRRGKPSPDPFLLAAVRHLGMKLEAEEGSGYYERPTEDKWHQLGIRPDEILVFEDGILGVLAAKAAGMNVIWVPDPELSTLLKSQNSESPPVDRLLDCLLHWNGAEWGLPSFNPSS